MKSFGVQSKTRRAMQLTIAYKIDGTPAMAVQGRYTVSAEQGGSSRACSRPSTSWSPRSGRTSVADKQIGARRHHRRLLRHRRGAGAALRFAQGPSSG